MMYDLAIIQANCIAGTTGLMHIVNRIREETPEGDKNRDIYYLNKAAMALQEAIVNMDHYMKATQTGIKIRGA